MMKRIQKMTKMTLVLTMMMTMLSGATVAVQAADHRPPRPSQWEDRWDNHRGDRPDYHRNDRKSKAQKDADEANKKANWALGISAVAAIIALSK